MPEPDKETFTARIQLTLTPTMKRQIEDRWREVPGHRGLNSYIRSLIAKDLAEPKKSKES